MCLYKPADFEASEEAIYYKVFTKTKRGGGSYTSPSYGKENIPTGKWINEKDYREEKKEEIEFLRYETCDTGTTQTEKSVVSYPIGWHCLLSYKDAKLWREHISGRKRKNRYLIAKVRVRNIVAKGIQLLDPTELPVIVAKEIYIEPKPSRSEGELDR
jgi:hypothetical protein